MLVAFVRNFAGARLALCILLVASLGLEANDEVAFHPSEGGGPSPASKCSHHLAMRSSEDFRKLREVNDALEDYAKLLQGKSLKDVLETLESVGLIEIDPTTVYRMDDHNQPIKSQQMPFTRVRLPFADTGFYMPNYPVGHEHRGLLLLMPGIGANVSHAGRMLDVAGTFHGHPAKNRGGEQGKSEDPFASLADEKGKFRLISFALDVTLNGMQDGAPLTFASQPGMTLVIRHARLIMGILYPHLRENFFLAGRSQGGAAAIAYDAEYGDARVVVATNPSSERQDVIDASLRVVAKDISVFAGVPMVLHHRAWDAYRDFTPYFDHFSPRSKGKVIILLSNQDTSYHDEQTPRSVYVGQIEAFVAAQSDKRILRTYDFTHDLWVRLYSHNGVKDENPHYAPITLMMAEHFRNSLHSD